AVVRHEIIILLREGRREPALQNSSISENDERTILLGQRRRGLRSRWLGCFLWKGPGRVQLLKFLSVDAFDVRQCRAGEVFVGQAPACLPRKVTDFTSPRTLRHNLPS